MEEKRIIAYKGFDENLCCRGFQYEIGKEYEQSGEIICCENGFHACKNPFDVLDYYSKPKNRYCVVEQSGTIKSDEEDTKQASSKIKIIKEINFAELFKAGIKWLNEKNGRNNRDNAQIGTSEFEAEIGTSKSYAQIGASGSYTQIGTSGNNAKIGTSGRGSRIGTSGSYTKIGSSGNYVQIGTSGGFVRIVSSGDYAQIGTSGYLTRISSSGGYAQIGTSGESALIESTGKSSVICCAGNNSIVKAKKGSWITLSEWGYSLIKRTAFPVCVKTEFVDGVRIKADTWYKLINGEFVEQTINK